MHQSKSTTYRSTAYYLLLLFVASTGLLKSAYGFATTDSLQFSVFPDASHYSAGDSIRLAIKVIIPPKYHLYSNPLGPGIGKPLQLSVQSNGVTWGSARKSPPVKFSSPVDTSWVWAYEKNALFFVDGVVGAEHRGEIAGQVSINALICNTSCIPVHQTRTFLLNSSTVTNAMKRETSNADLFAGYTLLDDLQLATSSFSSNDLSLSAGGLLFSTAEDENTPKESLAGLSLVKPQWAYTPVEGKIKFNLVIAIIFGFIAGIIMNFMPCVLPVLGIKILSFSQSHSSSKKSTIIHSLAFSAGMISLFLVLAGFASFANFSWGQQFQNPKVLAGIITIIFVFALGMFDLFTIMVPNSVGMIDKKSGTGLLGDFFKGVFATILATPCSGPLLGATLAWTLTQPPIVIFTIFGSIGSGMAFPYVLLSSSRRIARLVPKPGKWMNDFKGLLGFLLLGFVVYLMLGLPSEMVVPTVGVCLAMAAAVLFYSRFSPFGSGFKIKIITGFIAILIGFVGVYVSFGVVHTNLSRKNDLVQQDLEKKKWKDFSVDLLNESHKNKKTVLIDFTANWCLNCQYNKVAVLHTKDIGDLIDKKGVVPIKADLTQPDPLIESLLHHLGSRSIPFLAIFPGNNPDNPIVIRDIYQKSTIKKILNELPDDIQ